MTAKFDLLNELEKEFPCGCPSFVARLVTLMSLHNEKNKDYAGSDLGFDPLGNFKRVASILSNYPGLKPDDPCVVAVTYALKQIDQVLFSLSIGREGVIEGLGKRIDDIVVYMILVDLIHKDRLLRTSVVG